jgi:hypothetical protein
VCAVLVCGAVYAAVCIGVGTLLQRFLRMEPGPLESFWLGLAALAAFLEAYHLARAVDGSVAVALLVIGAAGFSGLSLARIVEAARRAGSWTCAIYAVLLVVIALRAATPCKFFDTGLYGAETVRWVSTYHVVPGLANLEGRFGFNSSVFLFLALLHHGVLVPLSYRVFDALLVAVLLARVAAACVRIGRGKSNSRQDWFLAILSFPLIYRVFESSIIADLVSTDTDLPALVAALAAIGYLFSALEARPLPSPDAEPDRGSSAVREKLLYAAALFAVAAAFKLSMAVLAGTGWLLGLIRLRSLKSPARGPRLSWPSYAGIPAAVVIPWIAHGLILSGYPFYPSGLFGIPVEWRLPLPSVRSVSTGIRDWARLPHGTLDEATGLHWIGSWFRNNHGDRADFAFPILIAMAGMVLILCGLQRRADAGVAQPAMRRYEGLWLLIPVACGLVFWFVQAPALRFGQAALWGAAAILGAYGIGGLPGKNVKTARWVLAALVLAEVWSIHPRTLWQESFASLADVRQFSPLPPPNVSTMKTRYGLRVNVALTDGQTWESELPSSAYFNPTLRLRRPGDLSAGFVSDGLPPNAEWTGP